ncbi:MAG TPA: transposase [Bryobacteraceae bacterium]|nr:transposase [Bryobacteraceae bacterium]
MAGFQVSAEGSLNQSIAELEQTIGKEGQKLEGHKNLTSIKGIAGLSAGILLSIIGDIGDFSDEGKLAAYFGIVPRISNSNETERSGRITKRATKLGRTTLEQCALIAQRDSPYLKNYYEKKKSRGTREAIIALARKFLGIIYRTLKNRWVFADFPNFALAERCLFAPTTAFVNQATARLVTCLFFNCRGISPEDYGRRLGCKFSIAR